jgi:hypothetical protein
MNLTPTMTNTISITEISPQMPASQLLWVNADVKSYKGYKRMSTAQASAINAHAQARARAVRNSLNQQALRQSSAATAVVGWSRWGTKTDESSSGTPRCQSIDGDAQKQDAFDRFHALVVKGDLSSRLVPRICGRDEALDPFDCAAAKIDSSIYDIIQFYLARIHPTSWTARAYTSSRSGPDFEAIEIVNNCMADRSRLYSLVSCIAAYVERAEANEWMKKAQPSAFYLQNAIVAVRAQVQSKDEECSSSDVLQSIVVMAVCAQFLQDHAASLAHLRATKHLIEQRGGFRAVEPGILRTIVRADLSRAIATLEAPVLDFPVEPTTIALLNRTCDAELERQSQAALLLLGQTMIPKKLDKYIRHIIDCTTMLEYVWTHPESSAPVIAQILSTIIARLYHLLSISFQSQADVDLYDIQKLEATRITLLLWTLLLTRSTRDGQHTYCDIPYDYKFTIISSEVKKRVSVSGLDELLMEWNQAIQILNQRPNAASKRIPPNLVRIIQAMEAETDIKLGGLMGCLFELEERHSSDSTRASRAYASGVTAITSDGANHRESRALPAPSQMAVTQHTCIGYGRELPAFSNGTWLCQLCCENSPKRMAGTEADNGAEPALTNYHPTTMACGARLLP